LRPPIRRRRRAAALEQERLERAVAEPAADPIAHSPQATEPAARSSSRMPAQWVVGLALLAIGVVLLVLVLSGALGML
jgi:hypothetical protein